MTFHKPIVAALTILSLALPAATTSLVLFAPSPAVAKDNGKSNGNRGGKAQSTREKGTKRGTPNPRSELKGANASNASATAMERASENSRVFAARTYRDAVIAAGAAKLEAADALDAVKDLIAGYKGRTSEEIAADIELLDEASVTYTTDLDTLNKEMEAAKKYEADLLALQTTANTLTGIAEGLEGTEEAALLALTDGRALSPEALAILRANLGL